LQILQGVLQTAVGLLKEMRGEEESLGLHVVRLRWMWKIRAEAQSETLPGKQALAFCREGV
jgi:hypothetical protein